MSPTFQSRKFPIQMMNAIMVFFNVTQALIWGPLQKSTELIASLVKISIIFTFVLITNQSRNRKPHCDIIGNKLTISLKKM